MIEWREVGGYDGAYLVSNRGDVKSVARVARRAVNGVEIVRPIRERLLKARRNGGGYPIVTMYKIGVPRTIVVHSIVASAFLGERPPGMFICHNDSNVENTNDWNLRYDTPKGNMGDRVSNGTSPVGEKNGNSRLNGSDVLKIRDLISDGMSNIDISNKMGVSKSTVSHIKTGRTWGHVV